MIKVKNKIDRIVRSNDIELSSLFALFSGICLFCFLYLTFFMNAPSDNHLTLLAGLLFGVFQFTAFLSGFIFYNYIYMPDTDWSEYNL